VKTTNAMILYFRMGLETRLLNGLIREMTMVSDNTHSIAYELCVSSPSSPATIERYLQSLITLLHFQSLNILHNDLFMHDHDCIPCEMSHIAVCTFLVQAYSLGCCSYPTSLHLVPGQSLWLLR